MSIVSTPKIYATVVADDGTYSGSSDILNLKFGLPVTSAVGEFEVKFAHGSLSTFSKYHDLNARKDVSLWLGTTDTGSAKKFAGKTDTVESGFDANEGYTSTLVGRDLGEALFRHKITKTYAGYTIANPSAVVATTSGSYDVHLLKASGSAQNYVTTINFGNTGSGVLYFVKPFSYINTTFASTPPANIYGTGSIYEYPISTANLPTWNLVLKLVRSGSAAGKGQLRAKLYSVDDTGSLLNPTDLSIWTSGTLVNFSTTGMLIDTINIVPLANPSGKYVYLEMLWHCTEQGSADSGVQIEWGDYSKLNIPNDNGQASNVVKDILSGSGVSEGTIETNTTALSPAYFNKKAFDALREISDIISTDFRVNENGQLDMWARQSKTATGNLLQTGSNILSFKKYVDGTDIRNIVHVYGAPESYLPSDGDYWTEFPNSGWVAVWGTVNDSWEGLADNTPTYPEERSCVGARMLAATSGSSPAGYVRFYHEITPPIDFNLTVDPTLVFHATCAYAVPLSNIVLVRLSKEPTGSERFETRGTVNSNPAAWTKNSLLLSDSNVSGSGVSGQWVRYGNIVWSEIKYIEFLAIIATPDLGLPALRLDGLRFEGFRWSGSYTDATSVASYGSGSFTEISDYYHSNVECQNRAEALGAIYSDPTIQYRIITTGSEALLPGRKIYLLLPSEGIDAATYYDMLAVTHHFTAPRGFVTELQLGSSITVRDINELQNYGILRAYVGRNLDTALRGEKRF